MYIPLNLFFKKFLLLKHTKHHLPLNLNTACRFLDDPWLFLYFVIVVHESLVGPEQFNGLLFFRKILQLLHILWFSSIFCIFKPFPTLTVGFWHWGQLRDSYTTIANGENIYWCSRRPHNALRAGGCKLLNRMMMCKYFSFCLTVIFFHLVLDFRSYINTYMFPRRQNKYNLPWSSNCQKWPSWASVHVFTFCNSYAWVPHLSSVLKDGLQNHTVNVGKG